MVLEGSGQRRVANTRWVLTQKLYICGEKSDQVAKALKEVKLLVEELKIDPPEFAKLIALLQFNDPDLTIHPGSTAPKRRKLSKLPKRLPLLLGVFGLLGLVLVAVLLTKAPLIIGSR